MYARLRLILLHVNFILFCRGLLVFVYLCLTCLSFCTALYSAPNVQPQYCEAECFQVFLVPCFRVLVLFTLFLFAAPLYFVGGYLIKMFFFITPVRRDRTRRAQAASEDNNLLRNTGETSKAASKNWGFVREVKGLEGKA